MPRYFGKDFAEEASVSGRVDYSEISSKETGLQDRRTTLCDRLRSLQ
jgi:hypothetical protein